MVGRRYAMTIALTRSPSVAYSAVRTAWNQFKAAPTDTAAIDNYLKALEQYNGILETIAV
ncbi:hypothetical protein [Prevotella jejuni]|uniref:hypothetical protein n=1 Tax=Prevotella jejuni TaxID=1177574 RepID=UPI001C5E505C|nr:hypothetical protein [Prevotella jejuni]MBW4771428.1 hypothetical protein [Prevotella jejuni]